MKRFMRVFLSWIFIFSLFYTGVFYIILREDGVNETDLGKNKQAEKELRSNEIKVLVMGVDTLDAEGNKTQRTDTLMLCRYDTVTGNISVLSIPRDTRAMIRGRKSPEKINHAHAYGGPELTIKAVKDLLGIEPDYYVRVDYKAVEEFVDLIGGVEVNVPMDMRYYDPYADPPLRINLKKGNQILDGEKALQFLRFRKGYKNQDLGRIEAQQQFVKSAVKQSLKPINIVKLPVIINKLYKYVDTDIPLNVVIKYIPKAKNINLDGVNMATLPGTSKMINGIWYFIPDKNGTQEIVKQLFTNSQVAHKE